MLPAQRWGDNDVGDHAAQFIEEDVPLVVQLVRDGLLRDEY